MLIVFLVVVVLCVCVFLAQVFEKDSDTHSYVLSLCVFYANNLSLSTKKIVRFNTSHVRFVVFFSVLFHCSHRSVFFSLCRILFAKSYASPFFSFFSYLLFLCCFCFGLMMMMMIMYMVCIL